MKNLSPESIEAAAKRIAAKHFFSNVETDADIEDIWQWTNLYDEDAVFEYSNDGSIIVWFPFDNWELSDVLDAMVELKDSIIHEMSKAR